MLRQISLTLALALAAPAGALAQGSAPDSIEVEGAEFEFSTDEIILEVGEEVTIAFHNTGNVAHNLAIPELGVTTETIQGGRSTSVTFTPEKSGTYRFICSVPGHAQAGMRGDVVVQ